jgi:hypothetical protein
MTYGMTAKLPLHGIRIRAAEGAITMEIYRNMFHCSKGVRIIHPSMAADISPTHGHLVVLAGGKREAFPGRLARCQLRRRPPT